MNRRELNAVDLLNEEDREWMKGDRWTEEQMNQKNRSFRTVVDVQKDLCERARLIIALKNHDYSSGSDNPYANFSGSVLLGIHPVIGILLRMQDKIMRIKTFVEKGKLKVKEESVDDALMDLINYSCLIKGIIEREKEKSDGDGK